MSRSSYAPRHAFKAGKGEFTSTSEFTPRLQIWMSRINLKTSKHYAEDEQSNLRLLLQNCSGNFLPWLLRGGNLSVRCDSEIGQFLRILLAQCTLSVRDPFLHPLEKVMSHLSFP
mmetsp:Transcript_16753/g.33858  ORF Transcript_16753/g.33858 Transcript_16753/m.33858 type:complete len:115 (-) Transcript_16753:929-1273(-)